MRRIIKTDYVEVRAGEGLLQVRKPRADIMSLILFGIFTPPWFLVIAMLLWLTWACITSGSLAAIAGSLLFAGAAAFATWIYRAFALGMLPVRRTLRWGLRTEVQFEVRCLGVRWRRRSLLRPLRLLVRPAYMRGDWGFSLRLADAAGSKVLLVQDTIIARSTRGARSQGEAIARAIGEVIDAEVAADGWEHWYVRKMDLDADD